MGSGALPEGLETLEVECHFNAILHEGVLTKGFEHLTVRGKVNKPLKVREPGFGQHLQPGVLPQKLQVLKLRVDQDLREGTLPDGLDALTLYSWERQPGMAIMLQRYLPASRASLSTVVTGSASKPQASDAGTRSLLPAPQFA